MKKYVLTEAKVLAAYKQGRAEISVPKNHLITPAARDLLKMRGMKVVVGAAPSALEADSARLSQQALSATAPELIAIGADHGGYALKSLLVDFLKATGVKVRDLGTHSEDPVDYPDIAHAVAETVAKGEAKAGIIIDGAGIGSAMVANKVPGIRAACCNDLFTATNSKEHNGANILTLGGRVIGSELAKKIVQVWLNTNFGGGRHQKRVQKIIAVDQKYRKLQ